MIETEQQAHVDRRAVLKLLAAVTMGTALAPLVQSQELAPEGLKGLSDVDLSALQDLARAYSNSDENDPEAVENMIERLRGANLVAPEVARALREEMKADFESGHLASLYGWQVSRTEAHVLAAAATLLA